MINQSTAAQQLQDCLGDHHLASMRNSRAPANPTVAALIAQHIGKRTAPDYMPWQTMVIT